MSTKAATGPGRFTSEFWFFRLFIVLILIFSLFCFYKPKTVDYSVFVRTWGFDHILFYSPAFKIAFYALALIAIIPYTNRIILDFVSLVLDKLRGIRKLKVVLFILVSAASVFLFYFFRVKYIFLGDFTLRLDQIMRKEFLSTEYLTMRLLYHVATLGASFGCTPQQMFVLYSCFAGGLFVLASCLIADILGKNRLQKLLLFLANISTALLLIFCGYVEIYATPVVLLSFYIYAGLRYLKHNRNVNFLIALCCLMLAVGSHLVCLAAVPSIVLLWYFNHKKNFAFIALASNKKIALFISAAVLIVLLIALKSKSTFILPLSRPANMPGYMTFFSGKHFWEVINGQLLCCGLSFLFVFVLLFKAIKDKIQLSPQVYFLLGLTGCIFFIVLVANLQRGSCDWDIMSFTAISLNMLTGLLIISLYRTNLALGSYLLAALVGLNALNAFQWVHVHHTDRSIKKIDKMLSTDPGTYYTSKIPGVLQLVVLYKLNNLIPETMEAGLRACNLGSNNVQGCIMYAECLKILKRSHEACSFYENLLARTRYVPEAYVYLFNYYEKEKQREKAVRYVYALFSIFMEQRQFCLSNINVKPKIYLVLFEYLYKIESQRPDSRLTADLMGAIDQLRTLAQQSK